MERRSTSPSRSSPLVGRRVRVVSGRFAGIEAPIASVGENGWWTLDIDNLEAFDTRVRSGEVRFLDELDRDGSVPQGTARRETTTNLSQRNHEASTDVQEESTGVQEGATDAQTLDGLPDPRPFHSSGRLPGQPKASTEQELSVPARKKQQSNSAADGDRGKKRSRKSITERSSDMYPQIHVSVPVPPTASLPLSDMVKAHVTTQPDNFDPLECTFPDQLVYRQGSEKTLSPVLLDMSQGRYPTLPELSHLDPDLKIDILDRRTGKVLSGAKAVRVRDLPMSLLLHAEYEPLIPSEGSTGDNEEPNSSIEIREGRSCQNVRISASVRPQNPLTLDCTNRAVHVIAGPHKGKIAKVVKHLMSRWLVLDIGPDTPHLTVSDKQVEVLPESMRTNSATVSEQPINEEAKPAARSRFSTEDDKELYDLFQENLQSTLS